MILDEIAEKTKERVEKCKQKTDFETMKNQALSCDANTGFPFEKQLAKKGVSFICEIKKASPSKGVIAEYFPYLEIAKEYKKIGADCISVLTEPDYFLGSTTYLQEIHEEVDVPLLRKDFTIDEYMIYEAKVIGASAVLLICSLLEEETLRQWISLCHKLGLSALVEAHDEEEIQMAVRAGARIIGVNNRNLKTFEVDIQNCIRQRKHIPPEILFVAESGIQTRKDIEALEEGGVDGVLIGETLMRSEDKNATLRELRGLEGR
ncbi:MAG: indole-3-glycerol phosphate synthase TrpC [Clostridiales bacterium]|nr:indole-3-glycerol phosphate synthase TrpC [Clostridiales bacterium]